MSYEIISTKQINCPCGKGKIEYTLKQNDWFQTKELVEIVCTDCKMKYEIVSKYYCPKPKHDYTVYYYKNKETGEKIKLDF